MTRLSQWKRVHLMLLIGAVTGIAAHAQIFTTLATFDGSNGANPLYMSLVQGRDGSLTLTYVSRVAIKFGFFVGGVQVPTPSVLL